ncbi:2'-5' RNA ligase family protein [Streptomyces sp. NPDC021622]|uniref:2'-5' RNA ligase family protein n=1 Tax=Streptomyces sp. NPDC021622 TaxID=3155013 RepID=UPI0033C524FE
MQLTTDPGAFPPAPPPSTTDASAIADHDWAAFANVEEMTNHWDRRGWTSSTRAYYWMLTFPDAALLIDQARHCQKELRPLGFDDVDEDALHLTLGRIGTVEQVSSGQLDYLIATAHEVRPEAFTLRAVPLTASRGAIRYSVAPWTPTVALHAALGRAGAAVGLLPKKPTSAFRPHIGITYSNRCMPAGPVRDAVSPLRSLDSVVVPVKRVRLVELRREGRAYRWDLIHEMELR